MKIPAFLVAALIAFILVMPVFGADGDEALSAFRQYKDVSSKPIKVPTVLELPIDDEISGISNFAVLETSTKTFKPYLFRYGSSFSKVPVSISGSGNVGSLNNMIDGDYATYTEFLLHTDGSAGSAEVSIKALRPITSSSLTFSLDRFVSLPRSVEVRAKVAGVERIVFASRAPNSQTIFFPKTTSDTWTVRFQYVQPLRIVELALNQEDAERNVSKSIRFLANPGESYKVYLNPDRYVVIQTQEAGDLSSSKGVLFLSPVPSHDNPLYIVADSDGDTIPDTVDNCVSSPNADQVDIDQNGRGDVCDDFDRDGVVNMIDNCMSDPNRNQIDTDADGIGDICDGEESRITEKYGWLPWAGMGIAAIVVAGLFFMIARAGVKK